MARASTTADVFNAIGEPHRRAILDLLVAGEKPVGAIAGQVAICQPQASKHLRVLTEVGLVTCRAVGRRRLYRLNPAGLRPVGDWLATYQPLWAGRLDRLEDYLSGPQQRPERKPPQRPQGAP